MNKVPTNSLSTVNTQSGLNRLSPQLLTIILAFNASMLSACVEEMPAEPGIAMTLGPDFCKDNKTPLCDKQTGEFVVDHCGDEPETSICTNPDLVLCEDPNKELDTSVCEGWCRKSDDMWLKKGRLEPEEVCYEISDAVECWIYDELRSCE
ncbi:hypothetical protein ACFL21_05505 [Patescibacteria group bacterium]